MLRKDVEVNMENRRYVNCVSCGCERGVPIVGKLNREIVQCSYCGETFVLYIDYRLSLLFDFEENDK